MSGEATSTTPQARLRSLAATATIGTDRLGGDTTVVHNLLAEAATCGLHARAGWRPRTHTGRLEPCPPDERPVAPAAAIARLRMLLDERDAGLIEEWATLALARGVRVDGATAPILLDWWTRPAKRPSSVFAVLGRLGEWLASMNAEWRGSAGVHEIPADSDTLWQLGTSAERLALLTSVRRLDPARALTLVASTWDDDAAADRQRFIEVLMEHASIADEPFLEAALDDRSKVVRRQAAAVLVRVPASRLRQRLSAAARRFISIESRGRVRTRTAMVLRPPESFDPAWERDGIEQRAPKGIGQRAWWLRQIIAGADLAIWIDPAAREAETDRKDQTGRPDDTDQADQTDQMRQRSQTEPMRLTPAAVLDALQGDDFAADAVHALVEAARLARDPEWSAALARHLLRQPPPVDIATIVALLSALSDVDAERLALEISRTNSLSTIERWEALAAIDGPWSPTFSREVMTTLSSHTPNATDNSWRASQLLEIASRRVDPDVLDLFERAAARSFSQMRTDTITRSLDRVRVRAEMRKELSS